MTTNSTPDPKHGEPHWLPTLAEIKATCEQIRSTWSRAEHENRAGSGRSRPATVPAITSRHANGATLYEPSEGPGDWTKPPADAPVD